MGFNTLLRSSIFLLVQTHFKFLLMLSSNLDHVKIQPELVLEVLHVDKLLISPIRRVNQAIYFLTQGARKAAFRNIKTIAECLALELINASKESPNSYAIKNKDQIERVAKSNR